MRLGITKGLSIVLIALSLGQVVRAETYDSPMDFLKKSTFNGDLRVYDFFRNYSSSTAPPNQRAFSAGGMLNFITAPILGGLRAGATYYLANSLGLNNSNPRKVDNTLPGFNVNVLGQAYLEYKTHDLLLIRAGDQLIKTPWVSDSDTRMIPATYQALYGELTPYKDLTFTAMRVTRFKSRTSNGFSQTNLYNTNNIGGQGFPRIDNVTAPGIFAVGANYSAHGLQPELWYYQFYDFAKLFYGDVTYTLDTGRPISPLIGVQVGHETEDGNNYLQRVPRIGGSANSDVWGALVGANIYNGRITLGYDAIPSHHGAFNNGGLVSPYTAGYATDPLYTTSMIAGLVEKGPGSAVKLTGSYGFFQNQLKVAASFAEYKTSPYFPNTNETDLDVTY
ncbi:MAG: OprD family outer membrane porin, partial [Gammaproteobacteria bacterium]